MTHFYYKWMVMLLSVNEKKKQLCQYQQRYQNYSYFIFELVMIINMVALQDCLNLQRM